jgi:hypothetical protein
MQRLLNFYSWDAGAADTKPAPAGHIMPGEPVITGCGCSLEPPGSPELELAYNEIKQGRFDPPGFVPDSTKSSPA